MSSSRRRQVTPFQRQTSLGYREMSTVLSPVSVFASVFVVLFVVLFAVLFAVVFAVLFVGSRTVVIGTVWGGGAVTAADAVAVAADAI